MNHHPRLTTVVCALCLLGGITLPAAEKPPREADDPAAVAALKPLANLFETDPQGRLHVLSFRRKPRVTDDDLRHLAGLAALHHLMLPDGIGDAGLDYVGKVRTLGALSLGHRTTDEGLKRIEPLTGLTGLDCDCPQVTDAGIEHLKGLRKLYTLSLRNTALTDAGLVHLTNMSEMHMLYLSDTRITDAGLEHLKAFHNLFALDVEGTDVTAEGLRKFQQAQHIKSVRGPGQTPRPLALLDLHAARRERTRRDDDPPAVLALKLVARSMEMDESGCVTRLAFREKVTDKDLKHLAGLAGPEDLHFPAGAGVTDAGLEYVGKVKTLASIDLEGLPITSDGLKRLQPLRYLFYLVLDDTKIDDRGLECLAGMERLYRLSLAGTAVTDAGLKHLRRLPDLHVLNLEQTGVSDAGLATLKEIPHLETLNLVGTRVTAAAGVQLKKDRPKLNVQLVEPESPYRARLH
jgi:hypothetical protein